MTAYWAIKPKNKKEGKIVREWFNKYREYSPGIEEDYYWHFPCYEVTEGGIEHYCYVSIKDNGAFYREINFEEFLKITGSKDVSNTDKLPDKWCIKSGDLAVVNYCNKYGAIPPYTTWQCSNAYSHFPSIGGTTFDKIQPGYIEISLADFKRLVLKQKNIQTNKIITYEIY